MNAGLCRTSVESWAAESKDSEERNCPVRPHPASVEESFDSALRFASESRGCAQDDNDLITVM
jgi:hypothetical protein